MIFMDYLVIKEINNKGRIMSKKDVLQKASDRIAEADTAPPPAAAPTAPAAPAVQPEIKKSAGIGKYIIAAYKAFWGAIKRTIHYIFVRIPTMFWNWVRGINIVALGNCALLLAIIIMFSMLINRVWDVKIAPNAQPVAQIAAAPQQAVTPRPAPKPVTVNVPARVTVDGAQDRLTVSLPLQRIVRAGIESGNIVVSQPAQPQRTPAQARRQPPVREKPKRPLVANVQLHGDKIIDGAARDGTVLRPDTRIRGNLFLQNHHRFTLPCGLHIDGSLYLRNVNLLRFCNDFTITGNIYVSRNSSFGPIPRTGRLGGQVIF